jgi:hypothetical protein
MGPENMAIYLNMDKVKFGNVDNRPFWLYKQVRN